MYERWDPEMYVFSKNYYDPVIILKMIKNGAMDLRIINDNYIYTTTKDGEILKVIIKNVILDPNNHIGNYIASVFYIPVLASANTRVFYFDVDLLFSKTSICFIVPITTINGEDEKFFNPPYKDRQTMGEILKTLHIMVADLIPAEEFEYRDLFYGRKSQLVPLDEIYDGKSFFTFKESEY